MADAREHGAITAAAYQKLFRLNKRQAQKDLTALVEAKVLVRR